MVPATSQAIQHRYANDSESPAAAAQLRVTRTLVREVRRTPTRHPGVGYASARVRNWPTYGTFTGMTDINSGTQGRFRLFSRLPAHCGDFYVSEPEAELSLLFGTIAGPFPRDFAKRENVPGPLPKYGGRGPGTRTRCPGGIPPNSRGKGALLRYVARRVGSGYVRHGGNDTRGLSSCLVNSTGSYAIAQNVQ